MNQLNILSVDIAQPLGMTKLKPDSTLSSADQAATSGNQSFADLVREHLNQDDKEKAGGTDSEDGKKSPLIALLAKQQSVKPVGSKSNEQPGSEEQGISEIASKATLIEQETQGEIKTSEKTATEPQTLMALLNAANKMLPAEAADTSQTSGQNAITSQNESKTDETAQTLTEQASGKQGLVGEAIPKDVIAQQAILEHLGNEDIDPEGVLKQELVAAKVQTEQGQTGPALSDGKNSAQDLIEPSLANKATNEQAASGETPDSEQLQNLKVSGGAEPPVSELDSAKTSKQQGEAEPSNNNATALEKQIPNREGSRADQVTTATPGEPAPEPAAEPKPAPAPSQPSQQAQTSIAQSASPENQQEKVDETARLRAESIAAQNSVEADEKNVKVNTGSNQASVASKTPTITPNNAGQQVPQHNTQTSETVDVNADHKDHNVKDNLSEHEVKLKGNANQSSDESIAGKEEQSAKQDNNQNASQNSQQQHQPQQGQGITEAVEQRSEHKDTEQLLDAIAGKITKETNANLKSSMVNLNDNLNLYNKDATVALKEKVMLMVNQKMQQVEIRLDPAELGSMHIRVNLQNEQASVSFLVQSQQAKEALEQNIGKLKEMLAESGVDVGNADIERQDKGEKNGQDDNISNQGQGVNEGDNHGDSDSQTQEINVSAKQLSGAQSGIDYYA